MDELLAKLPAIAAAVNSFKSEAVQQQVMAAILSGWSGGASSDARAAASESASTSTSKPRRRLRGKAGDSAGDEEKSTRTRRRPGSFTIVKDLDLRPKDKQSLKDFTAAKRPKGFQEHIAIAVHYMKTTLQVPRVSVDHVYTCFKDQSWRLPGDLANTISVTASSKGWLDSRDRSDIHMTTVGENLIEHDLPRQKS
ncbi:MAG TPA: hypothetical protein VIP52_01760 [Candidatus Dormibacteraeota bacterium]